MTHITHIGIDEVRFRDQAGDEAFLVSKNNDGDTLSLFAQEEIYIDRDFAGILAGHLQRWSETGSFLEPLEKAEPAEQAATKFLNGLGDEIKALSERVAALEQAKEPNPPQKYGLWNIPGEGWYSKSPFDSAGEAAFHAANWLCADWRNYWRVYPYPEDGGMPMELRETPVTVSPGGTNYVYDHPMPTLWGVWIDQDNRWAGSHIGEGCIAFFRSKVASEKYAFACGGEARPLPIDELVKDA